MLDIEQLKQDIEAEEGRVAHVYKDHLGYYTIGVGKMVDERKGGALPDSIIDAILDHDIKQFIKELDTRAPSWQEHPESVCRAIAGMAFQMGVPALMNFKKMWLALDRNDYRRAADEALKSKWAKQTPERAIRMAGMIRNAE